LPAASTLPAAPVIALMFVGVLVALFGHGSRSRAIVALGLALLFLATAAMIVGGLAAYEQDPGDPRPCTTALC
jgi:disulfide bond formation protein DsbB